MAGGVALPVAERTEVTAEKDCVGPVTFDRLDVVVVDPQGDRRLDERVERQVRVARREHDRAVDGVRRREGGNKPTRPVRDRTRARCETRGCGGGSACELHSQVGAGSARHAHGGCGSHPRVAQLDTPRHVIIPPDALQDLRMLVGDHQHTSAAAKNRTELGGMQQTFHRAVDHQRAAGQRRDHRRMAGERLRCAC